MKKTLLIIVVIVTMCLISACSFPGGTGTVTSPKVTTAPTSGSTTAAAPTDAPLPTLAELDSTLQAAAPTRIKLSLSSHHSGMGNLQTDCYMLFGTQNRYYYYYESQYFLPLAEALERGEAVGVRTGHLLTSGSTITASSEEIDAKLLSDLREYSIRKPNLREDLFAECTVSRQGDLVILDVRAEQGMAGLIFDERLNGVQDLAFTVCFTDGLMPIAYSVQMTAEDGTPIGYTATYSYTPAAMPTGDAIASPDLSLWE